ncbi:MAG TPA: M1 family metallopeptidase, partial [Chitinophagaceae bacterium]|nr:M1 family metallopeptidase [Chitinophagaceae bacterium]
MKKYILGLCTFFIFGITTAQNNIDILHYRFSIHLNDQNDTIVGRAKILFKALAPTHSISLDLASPKNNGKGMYVTNVSNGLKILTALHDNDIYTITLDKTLQENDTASIVIDYHGIPSDGLIISKNKYGHRTFFADNWPNRGHNWLPCHDDPADKATVDFIVTAPQHYQVVANGIQVEETNLSGDTKKTHWKEDVPISTKVMVIGAADFAVNLSGTVGDCIPVYSWVYPEDRDNGFYDYALAAKILPWYIQTVGPYAYKKLANVQSKTIFGGLENANTIFYSENSIDGRRTSESLLAHEIAHQWFGNYATEKSFAHLWLSEGFATY